MAATHDLLGGKVHLYRRGSGRFWQCSAYLAGRNHRATTKEEDLIRAKTAAEDWYLNLRLKDRSGELRGGKNFKAAADIFVREYEALTVGERNPRYVKSHGDRLRVHLLPFFGNKSVAEVTPGLVQEYRVHRMTSRRSVSTGEVMRPSRSTLHQEIVTLRHVLKTAERQGWIRFILNLSPPYKASGKISHRAWFSPAEYKVLYQATRERAERPPKPRWKWQCEQLHDYVLFMANTGLRPDEAARLEFRDVEIVKDQATGETILEISVRGKRGVGYCKSMHGAVHPFERLRDRLRPALAASTVDGKTVEEDSSEKRKPRPTDLLFPRSQRALFNAILGEQGLKKDREGLPRTAYSLRHSYICMRLTEGADIYQIAKNCRTSVEMIEKFYAAHIKDMIDTSAINVRKAANARRKPEERPKGRSPRAAANAKRPRISRK
jgi:integrase